MIQLWMLSTIVSIALSTRVERFECPGPANCTCTNGVSGDYDLICPYGLQSPKLIAQVLPEKYAQTQCTETSKWEDLKLLAGLKIGAVESFVIRFCPLPGISYKEIMQSVGVPSTQALVIIHGNFGSALNRTHLQGLHNMTKLNLNTNSLTNLPEDLFYETHNITWLDLKSNQVHLPKGIFRNIPKLEVLELGNNNLTYLEPGIFKNLSKLRLLNLWSNNLKNVTRSLFSDMSNLENLDLSSNGLNNLPPDLFADLAKLKNINLSSNNFIQLSKGLFLSNPSLERIQIQNNKITMNSLPPGLFANLTQLQNLFLDQSSISSVSSDLVAGSTALISIKLQNNLLSMLPNDFFKDNAKLENINLSFNYISSLPENLFQSTSQLKVLHLNNNFIKNISKSVFASLNNLEVLSLAFNEIEYIGKLAFERTVSLKTINLSNNKIKDIDSYIDGLLGPTSILKTLIKLESLNLAHNNITELFSDWTVTMTQLQTLDLSYNSLQNLSFQELHSITSQKLTLDLSFNKISYIDLDDAEELAINKLRDNWRENQYDVGVRVILSGNPLICDCNSYGIVNYFRDHLAPQVRSVVDFVRTDFNCAGDNELKGKAVSSVDPRLLTCNVEPCTDNCTCTYRPYDQALLVDCSTRNFKEIPKLMPNNYTLRNIDAMTNHTIVDLSYNNLEILPIELGPGYERVTKINFAHNKIRKINMSTFAKTIQIINLDNNNLTRMDYSSINAIRSSTSLTTVTLNNNPWICDCQAWSFIDFVFNNVEKLPNVKNITCSSGKPVSSVKENEICPNSAQLIVIISIIFGVVGGLSSAIAAVYFIFPREIKVWLYAHKMCLWFVTEEELDKDKQYDAFVSYSHLDESFIVDKLVPGLENGSTNYKLCLHYRDWIVGDYIPSQIARSVENSRRTIVVLSPNFVESEWGRMEFRAAHSQALSEGRARVILILYGDIGPTENLDPELKSYLAMNTYVKWGDPWFWDKLRYALPHPMGLSKGMPLTSQTGNKLLKRKSRNEKLINGIDSNVINTSETTPPADIIADPLKLIDSKLS